MSPCTRIEACPENDVKHFFRSRGTCGRRSPCHILVHMGHHIHLAFLHPAKPTSGLEELSGPALEPRLRERRTPRNTCVAFETLEIPACPIFGSGRGCEGAEPTDGITRQSGFEVRELRTRGCRKTTTLLNVQCTLVSKLRLTKSRCPGPTGPC